MALVQLTGGSFQDLEGNILDSGYLMMTLSHDELDPGTGTQIVSGIPVKITLNNVGSIAGIQSVWATDVLQPPGAFYIITAFRADGAPAWSSQQFQFVPSGATFNVGTWIPNQPVPQPPPATILLQTNGVNNSVQNLENLVAGTNISVTNSLGSTTINNTVTPTPPSPTFINAMRGWQAASTNDTRVLSQMGFLATNNDSITIVAPTSTKRTAWQIGTGTVAYFTDTADDTNTGLFQNFQASAQVVGFLTDQKSWVCFTPNTGVTVSNPSVLHSDNPNASVLGFRFSTDASDVNWKCYASTSNTLFTIVDSGVAVDTGRHTYRIALSGGTATYYIDGTQVGTISTNIPSSSTNMCPAFYSESPSRGNANRFLVIEYLWFQ